MADLLQHILTAAGVAIAGAAGAAQHAPPGMRTRAAVAGGLYGCAMVAAFGPRQVARNMLEAHAERAAAELAERMGAARRG